MSNLATKQNFKMTLFEYVLERRKEKTVLMMRMYSFWLVNNNNAVPGGRVELPRDYSHTALNRARLPIPPSGHNFSITSKPVLYQYTSW